MCVCACECIPHVSWLLRPQEGIWASGATVPGHYEPLVYVGVGSSGRALWSAGATSPHPLWREDWKSHVPYAEVALCSPCILTKLLPLPSLFLCSPQSSTALLLTPWSLRQCAQVAEWTSRWQERSYHPNIPNTRKARHTFNSGGGVTPETLGGLIGWRTTY